MKDFDRHKNLTELEGEDWGKAEYDSQLLLGCYELRKKPLYTFSIEDLRILIGQQVSLDYLLPIALEYLEENPLVHANFFPGDLLNNVLMINYSFWGKNLDLKSKLDLIIKKVIAVPEELEIALSSYLEAFPLSA